MLQNSSDDLLLEKFAAQLQLLHNLTNAESPTLLKTEDTLLGNAQEFSHFLMTTYSTQYL